MRTKSVTSVTQPAQQRETTEQPATYHWLQGYKPETIAAVIGNHLRRAASSRLPPLESGLRDPWSERR